MHMLSSGRFLILSSVALLNLAALAACGQSFSISGGYTPVGYSDGQVQYAPDSTPPAPPVIAAEVPVRLTDAQLDQLTGPIALFPDPLLAQVLPAASYPQEVIDAQAWLQANANPDDATIDAQNWDPSVKALIHYPTVLAMLAQNPDWTQALGAAFINQQPDIMESIQRLRLEAQNVGTLATTPQQQVVWSGNNLQILPADPAVIYVPAYDPQVVYTPVYPGVIIEAPPRIWYGPGIRIGGWLNADLDWEDHWIIAGGGWHHGWVHDPYRGWEHDAREDRDWHRQVRDVAAQREFHDNTVHVGQPWQHDPARPAPRMPAPVAAAARQATIDEHRGWAQPTAPARLPIAVPHPAPPSGFLPHTTPPHQEPGRPVTPHSPPPLTPPHPTPIPPSVPHVPAPPAPHTPPLPAPSGNVFGGYQNRTDVQRAQERAQESHPPTPAPVIHPAMPAAPAPRPTAPPTPVLHAPPPETPTGRSMNPPAPVARPSTPAPAPQPNPAPAPVIHSAMPPAPAPHPTAPPTPVLHAPPSEAPTGRPMNPPAPVARPSTPAPAPQPTPAPSPARPVAPPPAAPAAHPAPAVPAFQSTGSGDDTKTQSDRGHASMQHN